MPRDFLALQKGVRVWIVVRGLGHQLSVVHQEHKWPEQAPIELHADHRRHPGAIHELLQVGAVFFVVARVIQVLKAAEEVVVLLDAANYFQIEWQDQVQHVIHDVYIISMLAQAHLFKLTQLHLVVAEMLHVHNRSEAPLQLVRCPLHEQVRKLATQTLERCF